MVPTGEEAKEGTNQKRVFILQRQSLTGGTPVASTWPLKGTPASSCRAQRGTGTVGPGGDRGCDAGCSDRREVGERAECQAAARRWASCRPPTLEDSPRFPACSQMSKILKQQQQQQQKMRCFCLPQHVSVLIKRMFCFVFKATNLENNFRDFFLFFVFLFYLNFF